MSESEDLSFHSVAMPSESVNLSFKSRFLKTDKSKALLQEQATTVPLVPTNIAPLPGSLRGMRSTFSPTKLSKLPENVEVKPNADSSLSKNIKEFINRTDHVSMEWKTLGQNSSRASLVTRWSYKKLALRSLSWRKPRKMGIRIHLMLQFLKRRSKSRHFYFNDNSNFCWILFNF